MKRADFLKKGILGTGVFALSATSLKALTNDIDELSPLEPMNPNEVLGFNHIPNTESKKMENSVLHLANTRGDANHGWLHSKHTFSFANYYNPDRMHFGALRVLNDDKVAAGMGFGTHPHDNMEIISIPLSGDLEHKDSMGNIGIIKNGEVQVMSAGTGVTHSEYNHNKDKEVKFLQIWVFPKERNVVPRYDQILLDANDRKNNLQQIISPNPTDAGTWIHQDAWFSLGDLSANNKQKYTINKPGNGVYVFVLSGSLKVGEQVLSARDGYGVWNIEDLALEAITNTEVLLMEVPMQF